VRRTNNYILYNARLLRFPAGSALPLLSIRSAGSERGQLKLLTCSYNGSGLVPSAYVLVNHGRFNEDSLPDVTRRTFRLPADQVGMSIESISLDSARDMSLFGWRLEPSSANERGTRQFSLWLKRVPEEDVVSAHATIDCVKDGSKEQLILPVRVIRVK
jgi:hypothetical protein